MPSNGNGNDLPDYCTAGVLVLGCGNPLMGDDGFGPAVAERLLRERAEDRGQRAEDRGLRAKERGLGIGDGGEGTTTGDPPVPSVLSSALSVCVINAGTGSRGIIFNLVTGPQRPRGIIIVDALEAGRPPGELFWIDIEDLSLEKAEDFSLHMTPASNMLLELKRMGVEIRVLACQPGMLPEFMTEGLSPALAGAVGNAAGMVLGAAQEILMKA